MRQFYTITRKTLNAMPDDFWIQALGTKPLAGAPGQREDCTITAPVRVLKQLKGDTITVVSAPLGKTSQPE